MAPLDQSNNLRFMKRLCDQAASVLKKWPTCWCVSLKWQWIVISGSNGWLLLSLLSLYLKVKVLLCFVSALILEFDISRRTVSGGTLLLRRHASGPNEFFRPPSSGLPKGCFHSDDGFVTVEAPRWLLKWDEDVTSDEDQFWPHTSSTHTLHPWLLLLFSTQIIIFCDSLRLFLFTVFYIWVIP